VDLAGEQIDAGQQADRSVALVLVVAREGRLSAGLGRQVRGGRGDCLNAGLLIVGDNRHRIARFLFCGRRRLLDELHFAIDAQNLRHLLLELGVAAFQVVADLVRLHLLLIEDLAHRACRGRRVLRRVHARARDEPEAASSTTRADSPGPSPCGRPEKPAMPWPRPRSSAPCPAADDYRAPPSGHRPTPARRNAGPSDDALPKRGPPQRTRGLPGRPTTSAPARPGPPAPFASGLSKPASPNPLLRSTTRSLAATPS